MNNDIIGVGIIGLGGFGNFLIEQWNKMAGVKVTAASDQVPERAPSNPEIRFYTSDTELFADPEVDVISVATPPSTHKSLALSAIAAGKHVLIEKPIALSTNDAKEIVQAAKEAGVVASVNFMLRYNPLVEALKQVVDEGIFGKLRRVDLRNYATQDTVPEGHWFWSQDVSGGILVEHGVHFFDMASWFIDSDPARVTGLTVSRNDHMEDRVFAAVEYENGCVGTFWHSFTRPVVLETTTFHMAFDLGEIDVTGWVPLSCSYWGWTDEVGLEKLSRLLPDPLMTNEPFEATNTHSLDMTYWVSRSVRGRYELLKIKQDVYGDCLRAILKDMIDATRNPDHKMRVTALDGCKAVDIAERATVAAHKVKG